MNIISVWSKENDKERDVHVKKVKCCGDIDYEYVVELLWKYLQEGFVVSFDVLGDKR